MDAVSEAGGNELDNEADASVAAMALFVMTGSDLKSKLD